MIASTYRAHRAEGFTVLAIDYEESPATVRRFWDELKLEPTPFLDPDGKAAAAYGVGLRATGLPASVFIRRDGRVSAYAPFTLDSAYLATQLKAIL